MRYIAEKFYVKTCLCITDENIYISDIKYALIHINNEYICAYNPELKADEEGIYFTNWAWSHIFNELEDAKLFLINKLNDRIKDLAEEIADITDTIESVMEYDDIHFNDLSNDLPFK